MNVPVARTSLNTLTLTQVKIYFRQYPGPEHGSLGAIANAPYVLRAGSTSVSGNTDGSGAVVVNLPTGDPVQLEILGTTYELTRLAALEAIDTLSGAQRRLNMLGYRAGSVDGLLGVKTDTSLLEYQGDHGLTITGLESGGAVPQPTRDSLSYVVGH